MADSDIPVVEKRLRDLPDAVEAVAKFGRASSLDVVEPQPIFERMLRDHPRLRWDDGIAFFRMEDILAAGRDPAIVTSASAYGGMGA
jgi:hypothetical protein